MKDVKENGTECLPQTFVRWKILSIEKRRITKEKTGKNKKFLNVCLKKFVAYKAIISP